MAAKTSEKRRESREQLPEELRGVFDDLVVDYQAFAMEHHARPFVSYAVLADLVREGWRRTEPPQRRELPKR